MNVRTNSQAQMLHLKNKKLEVVWIQYFPSPFTLFSLPITQNWWVPQLFGLFGFVFSFYFHHSTFLFLSDVDMAKQAGRVQVESIRFAGQTGYRTFLNGSIGLRVGSGLPVFFKQVFFFFFLNYKNKLMTTCLERMNESIKQMNCT